MHERATVARKVANSVRREHDHGLRNRDCRNRWASGDDSMESRWDANGIMAADLVSSFGVCDGGFLHAPEFLDRGVAAAFSRRRSKLWPVRAICGRIFSGVSWALAPLLSSVEARATGESSASSSTGEPDERLCI